VCVVPVEGIDFYGIYPYDYSADMPIFSQCATTAVCDDDRRRRRRKGGVRFRSKRAVSATIREIDAWNHDDCCVDFDV